MIRRTINIKILSSVLGHWAIDLCCYLPGGVLNGDNIWFKSLKNIEQFVYSEWIFFLRAANGLWRAVLDICQNQKQRKNHVVDSGDIFLF